MFADATVYVHWLQNFVPLRHGIALLAVAVAALTLTQLPSCSRRLSRRSFGGWLVRRTSVLFWLSVSWLWLDGALDRGGAVMLSILGH